MTKSKFKVSEAGAMGREIYNNLVKGLDVLVPTSGRIFVQVDLEIEDENLFKDDESRKSKLIIEVNLKEK